jgi:hypothetical protein
VCALTFALVLYKDFPGTAGGGCYAGELLAVPRVLTSFFLFCGGCQVSMDSISGLQEVVEFQIPLKVKRT